ncbi:keratin-associated protein 27-1 [Sciurus carolinensis]|uniref:keratin-associated protein 27-1 n=1 Tax=Sciurus carolinensis TaxID=30640 RepID=UPI001FB4C910|nr:keratin-associated protein 27-1 [Sciurus carolinensis]
MSENHCHSLKGFRNAPPLSAIVHDSNPVSFEDGFCLPSSCHNRTWLLDSSQETCSETTTCQVTSCKQDQFREDACAQSTCHSRVVQTTCSNSEPCERTTCPPGSCALQPECASQPCQPARSRHRVFVAQRCQPASYMVKYCPLKSSVSRHHQTLDYESSQCQSQTLSYNSYSPWVQGAPGSQLLESSSTYEPTCCVTGGLQLPSK